LWEVRVRTKVGRRVASAAVSGIAVLALAGGVASAKPLFQMLPQRFSQQPTTAYCETNFGFACYSAGQIRHAYGVDALNRHGLTGAGTTIVLVESYGSPTIQSDLQTFDQQNGLPAPPSFDIIQPEGKPPPYNGTINDDSGWAIETSLDVEYSHAMAPGANILLVETPVDETEGLQGLPQMMQAEDYVIDHHLGDVISQSFGATELTFQDTKGNFDPGQILGQRYAFENAYTHGVTVLAASGDAGATDYELNVTDFYPFRVIDWPSSDPLVTSVGGTQLTLDAFGNRTAPDQVWNDTYNPNVVGPTPSPAAGSGGVSDVFARPFYQDGVRWDLGDRRGTPDLSMSAAVNGGANVYLGFTSTSQLDAVPAPGWYVIGGTSEASPLFSGEVAIADQIAGHPVGLIDPSLYQLGDGWGSGLTDITRGNNTVTFTNTNNVTYRVKGYDAVPGYDLASGLGTANAALPFELAALSRGGERRH
jgi:subtilase family serine protease